MPSEANHLESREGSVVWTRRQNAEEQRLGLQTFAVDFGEGPVNPLLQIRINGDVLDARNLAYRFYRGRPEERIDPDLWYSGDGLAGLRGRAVLICRSWPMAPFGDNPRFSILTGVDANFPVGPGQTDLAVRHAIARLVVNQDMKPLGMCLVPMRGQTAIKIRPSGQVFHYANAERAGSGSGGVVFRPIEVRDALDRDQPPGAIWQMCAGAVHDLARIPPDVFQSLALYFARE